MIYLCVFLLQFINVSNLPTERNFVSLKNVNINTEKIKSTPNLRSDADWYFCELIKKDDDFILFLDKVLLESEYGSYRGLCRINLTKGIEDTLIKGNGNGPLEISDEHAFNYDKSSNSCFIYDYNTKKMIVYSNTTKRAKEFRLKYSPDNGVYAIHNALYKLGSFEGIYNDALMYLMDDNGLIKKKYKGYDGIENNTNALKLTGRIDSAFPNITLLRYFPLYIKDDGDEQSIVCYNAFDFDKPIEKYKKKYKPDNGSYMNVYNNIQYILGFSDDNYIGIMAKNTSEKTSFVDIYDKSFNYYASIDATELNTILVNYIKKNVADKNGFKVVNTRYVNRSQYAYYISEKEIVYVDFLELFKANYQAVN